ncbi:hypothetical protein [Massilia aurea]|uniref:hypothetical protein n=1 Tax=Massilia aurea TaxID=373040 RepID=UPI00160E6948|nr:hypothetical protein [Massilia aurea]
MAIVAMSRIRSVNLKSMVALKMKVFFREKAQQRNLISSATIFQQKPKFSIRIAGYRLLRSNKENDRSILFDNSLNEQITSRAIPFDRQSSRPAGSANGDRIMAR